mmetsp:Transcript_62804/g.112010  ORF Transcript_62804/g.112010 Transcript_62804/m.112010 type:complete len:83 (-) Transcript_62804:1468-1716(-)
MIHRCLVRLLINCHTRTFHASTMHSCFLYIYLPDYRSPITSTGQVTRKDESKVKEVRTLADGEEKVNIMLRTMVEMQKRTPA